MDEIPDEKWHRQKKSGDAPGKLKMLDPETELQEYYQRKEFEREESQKSPSKRGEGSPADTKTIQTNLFGEVGERSKYII